MSLVMQQFKTGSLYSPTIIGRNHPVYFDVVTYFNGDDHCEPAGAQP